MKLNKNLYFGEEAGKKKAKIINQLDKHQLSFGVYVITLASNGKDLLDVLPAFMLYRNHTRDREILGIAVTKEEAFEVCGQIIADVHSKTGAYDVRSFFA